MERITLGADDRAAVPVSSARAGAAYDGGPETIPAARHFAADFLTRLRDEHDVPVTPRAIDTVQLIVSELITNVCKYAPGPCLMDLELIGDSVEITVWDSDSVLPVARAAEPGRVGQHGLEIVLALCEGFDVQREPVGKRIKVRVSLAAG
ncbi:ATP-binding protein [Streptomyces macrosporus]|uniref:ATP-binding protein n=1 Tax=Streptomyces macrosporus TaxID=44032 RepID=A0ABN3JWS8_9ACTN